MTITGTLLFHSETGTEGGYWAMQDEKFLHTDKDLIDGLCPWGQLTPFTDGRKACPAMPEYWEGDEPPMELQHASYEGLHTLRDGDHLRVYDLDGALLWEGDIDLQQHSLFTEDAFGMWIHADQRDMDRDTWATWFFKELPCELDPAEGSHT